MKVSSLKHQLFILHCSVIDRPVYLSVGPYGQRRLAKVTEAVLNRGKLTLVTDGPGGGGFTFRSLLDVVKGLPEESANKRVGTVSFDGTGRTVLDSIDVALIENENGKSSQIVFTTKH